MTHVGGVQSWCLGVTLPLILAAVLHQGLATVAPPTTAQTTAAPHNDPGRPEKGNYMVTKSNGTVCLLASVALQLNISYNSLSQNKIVQDVVNLQPNLTKASGSCDLDRASLQLFTDELTHLNFTFTLNATSNKYHLSQVSLLVHWPDMKDPLSAFNGSVDELRGTFGFSYMCREEQTLSLAQNWSINTFQLQVQPFGITGDQFGAAEECLLDEDDMLIPIIVGAALAGLVLIVLLAYFIGRKRSQAGYQTI